MNKHHDALEAQYAEWLTTPHAEQSAIALGIDTTTEAETAIDNLTSAMFRQLGELQDKVLTTGCVGAAESLRLFCRLLEMIRLIESENYRAVAEEHRRKLPRKCMCPQCRQFEQAGQLKSWMKKILTTGAIDE